MDVRIDKLASLLVHYSCNVQQGEKCSFLMRARNASLL